MANRLLQWILDCWRAEAQGGKYSLWLRLLKFITSNKKILTKALQDRGFFCPVHTPFSVENGGSNALKFTFQLKSKCFLKGATYSTIYLQRQKNIRCPKVYIQFFIARKRCMKKVKRKMKIKHAHQRHCNNSEISICLVYFSSCTCI